MTAAAAPDRSGAAPRVALPLETGAPGTPRTGDAAALSTAALRLAVGDGAAATEVRDWGALFALARRERLAALGWARSGAAIRAAADDATVALWRSLWAGAVRRSERLLAACGEVSAVLASRGVPVVLLKGVPLADRLYGDVSVRCSDDVDCFVGRADRASAGRALRAAGWTSVLGGEPDDETYESPDGEVRLEVHSTLVGDRLDHLPVGAPASERRRVGSSEVDVHGGPLVPAYLAAHMATHFAPPLLWWLDLYSYWSSLSAEERSEARGAAARAGLGGYLRWGLRGARAVEAALGGDARALRAVGVREAGRRDVHQIWRHLRLAPSVGAAKAVAINWVRPSWAAERDGGVVVGTLRRAARHWREMLPSAPPSARGDSASATAPGVLSAEGLIEAARTIVAAGGQMSLSLTGESMAPTLRPGDRLLLGGMGRAPRPGDIVLVAVDRTRPVIHRVVRAEARQGGRLVQTRGDNCATADPAVPADAVVARVLASERDGRWTAHAWTMRYGIGAALRGRALALRARAANRRRRLGASQVARPLAARQADR